MYWGGFFFGPKYAKINWNQKEQTFNGESVIFRNEKFKNQRVRLHNSTCDAALHWKMSTIPKWLDLCTLGTSFKERSQVSGNIKSLGPICWIGISPNASDRMFNHISRRILRIMLEILTEKDPQGFPKTDRLVKVEAQAATFGCKDCCSWWRYVSHVSPHKSLQSKSTVLLGKFLGNSLHQWWNVLRNLGKLKGT